MRAIETTKKVEIPEDVDVKISGRAVTVIGRHGELTRDFSHAPVSITLEGSRVIVQANWPRKKEAAIVGTICSHIRNMITGSTTGFTYKLMSVFSHFPISVKVKDRTILIENFTGERSPRKAKIIGAARVAVKGEEIIVQGTNIEEVSQTAANIERAVKVKRKDHRVFLDGIYVYKRLEGFEE